MAEDYDNTPKLKNKKLEDSLKIKVVDTLNQAEYVIEEVSYTTEPDILVPALVCVPKSVQLPAKKEESSLLMTGY